MGLFTILLGSQLFLFKIINKSRFTRAIKLKSKSHINPNMLRWLIVVLTFYVLCEIYPFKYVH